MYDALLAALRLTGIPFAETAWDQRPSGAYGVVAVDSALHFYADDHVDHQAPRGTVDLYTPSGDREAMAAIQAALNGLSGCAWYLNSIQYEDDTRLLHWEWVFTLESW